MLKPDEWLALVEPLVRQLVPEERVERTIKAFGYDYYRVHMAAGCSVEDALGPLTRRVEKLNARHAV